MDSRGAGQFKVEIMGSFDIDIMSTSFFILVLCYSCKSLFDTKIVFSHSLALQAMRQKSFCPLAFKTLMF